ncbi:hypothetical protein OG716_13635 [Nocardia sp. NBC_01388]
MPHHVGATIAALTDGLGADAVMEAVGTPETFELAVDLMRAGGHVRRSADHYRAHRLLELPRN